MSDIAIQVEGLSKLYMLGQIGTGTISRDLERWWASVRGKEDPFAKIGQSNDRTKQSGSDFVWSLRDLNFEVHKGDVLGIIGRNGAGKSTLLKILSKITSPTTGKICIDGRIASLLEVGTGFHPEMTGRENIFLNGAILGMRRHEIQRKLDEIIDFAGVAAYVDTPVKRYSSGMYVRLAFAVAAFLEPEILIVDEVLAVGDAEFQKKCLGRMKEVSVNEGRTVLFVSHNMAAVKSLCTKGMVLHHGELKYQGSQLEAVQFYQSAQQGSHRLIHEGPIETAPGNQHIRLMKFQALPIHGEAMSVSSGVRFEAEFFNYKENINLDITFELVNMDEVVVFHHGALISQNKDSKIGLHKVSAELPPNFLNAGTYRFNIIFGENQRHGLWWKTDIIQFEILNEMLGSNSAPLPGVIRPDLKYLIETP
jgi:lipopolysaccharide transport system ATP-binding protein